MKSIEEIRNSIRVIEDFPVKGIHFQDVTTLFKDAECTSSTLEMIYGHYKDKGITKVVGLESRGFILGGALALKLGAGFVPARKPGKLPGETISQQYSLEYGKDAIHIHTGAIDPGDVVLIHDDLIATGGTLSAAVKLVRRFGVSKIYLNTIIDLTACPRVEDFPSELPVFSLINIDVD